MSEQATVLHGLGVPSSEYGVEYSVGSLTPTVCALFGLEAPKNCQASALPSVLRMAAGKLGQGNLVKKALLYCPDAIGHWHYQQYPETFASLDVLTEVREPLLTVQPSVTPVCFATIFSGLPPSLHGIEVYSKPVLLIETLFDVFIQADKKVAIVAINNCSMDKIFRDRKMDYYSMHSDAASRQLTKLLMAEGDYDLLVSYYYDYDHESHHSGNTSKASLQSLRTAVETFTDFSEQFEQCSSGDNRLLAFIPDHGNHNTEAGLGTHGTTLPEDMVVNHFYQVKSGEK